MDGNGEKKNGRQSHTANNYPEDAFEISFQKFRVIFKC